MYEIVAPSKEVLIGHFRTREAAQAVASVLDDRTYRSKKKYEEAKKAGWLHKVREVQ